MARRRRIDDEFDDDDVDDLEDEVFRPRRRAERRPRRRRLAAAVMLVALLGAVWFAPVAIVTTSLRDVPLRALFAGIDGVIESGGARWQWFGSIAFHDLVLRDRAGTPVAFVPHGSLDRGLVALLMDRRNLGTVRLFAPEARVEVRRGGSSLEDIVAPWLAGLVPAADGSTPALAIEIVDGRLALVDLERSDAWEIDELIASSTLDAAGGLSDWTLAGQVRRAEAPATLEPPRASVIDPAARIDGTTIAAGATAMLAREGGFSVSSPAGLAGPRRITGSGHRLPLGASAVLATRFAYDEFLDGRGDVRIELALDGGGPHAAGGLALERATVRRMDTGAEIVTLGSCEMPFDLAYDGRGVAIRRLSAVSRLLRVEATGVVTLPEGDLWEWAGALVEDDFSVTAQVDVAALAESLPGGLTVRPEVRLTGGSIDLSATAHADGADRVLEVKLSAHDLAGIRTAVVPSAAGDPTAAPANTVEERSIAWTEPFSAWLRGRLPPGRRGAFRIDEARISSAAIEASAAGTASDARLQWTADLGALFGGVAALFDVGDASLVGTSRGTIELTSDARGETSVVRATAGLADVALASAGRPPWNDAEIRLEADATGRLSGSAAIVDRAALRVAAGGDTLETALVGGVIVDLAGMVGLTETTAWARPGPTARAIVAEGSLVGDLGRWHARLAPFMPAASAVPALGGKVQASATVASQDDVWRITKAAGDVERFTLSVAGREINEPRIVATAAGLIDPVRGRYELSSGEVLTPTVSLRTGGLAWAAEEAWAASLAAVRGKLQWQADVGRLARWVAPAPTATAWPATGRTWGTIEVSDAQDATVVLIEATGSQLALAERDATPRPAGQPPGADAAATRPVWEEPHATVGLEITLPRGAAGFTAGSRIDRLAVQSSTVGLVAAGTVGPVVERRFLELDGTVAWDWAQVSRLISPWTGGAVRLAGGGTRPFALRSPLLPPPAAAAPAPPPVAETATVMLPESWLAATRGAGSDAPRSARIARPAATAPRDPATLVDRFREISLDTSIAWQAADIGGVPLAAGELPMRLVEGQLACGPFDIGVAGGRVRGAPWISFLATPWEIVLPPGRLVERVSIAEARAQQWIARLSPLLGRTTRTDGFVTFDGAGGRIPLATPLAGELAGQVLLENLEVTPAGTLQPFINLLVRLQSAADPRFAIGDKAVLLRVRPEPVRVRLAGGRLEHEGLVMDSGPLVVRSSGSVAADGTLAMVVEVALRAEVAGDAPVVARLLRTPLAIPLRGTLDRPQFDARAIDTVVARIVDNTAEAVLRDGFGRGLQGLETLFGNPQPPEPPLSLPPGR